MTAGRWENPPKRVNVWEARSALRWGSKSQGHFKTEEAARAFAEKDIAKHGGVGKIGHVERYTLGGVVYYDRYEEMA